MGLNHTVIQGRFTRDPELRKTGSSVAVCSFILAVEQDYKLQDGERGVDWIDCVAWRHTAEFVSKYFAKGRMAIVSGRLQTRTYEDNEGVKRKVTELVADNVYFGDSKHSDSEAAPAGEPEFAEEKVEDGELPF